MGKFASVLLVFGLSISNASADSGGSEEFCARTADDIVAAAYLEENRLSFGNYGGLMNGGVCWWHSRFQRASLYLARFRPELPRPDAEEAKRLINALAKMNKVVEIPGYANLGEFSREYGDLIQRKLERWQKTDGFIRQSWVQGLRGAADEKAEKLATMMHKLHEQVSKKRIVYQKLQVPGIPSHAWLVIGMTRHAKGYDLEVIDSNYPDQTGRYEYRYGDTSLYLRGFGAEFVPYIDNGRELDRALKALGKYCGRKP